jgi:outer membrane protein assembly factor BamA
LDLRFYYAITKGNQIATRIFTGVGIPMGNSGILPNLKQFFVGGSSSLRAFQLRSVGPGTYAPDSAVGIPNQTGDIRLEYNIEDRIKIAKQLELALFFDIGNIWLARNDPSRPGSQFNFNTFYRQLASGWGWGIRYINQFFILRVDVGYPVHRPNPNLSKHAVWNLGIGYPF